MSRRANTMLSRRWAGGASNIIYQLYNHTCDGTAATCIDTGIKLFSQAFIQEHPKFQIEISYQAEDNNPNNAHILRCCKTVNPYLGFVLRFRNNDTAGNGYAVRTKFKSNGTETFIKVCYTEDYLLPVRGLLIIFDLTVSSNQVKIEVKNRNSGLQDDSTTKSFPYDFDTVPFTIGGSVINGEDASGGWKEMWKGTITSLIIRDI